MYTQCPECSTAFRVTAEVLKQAAGKVRCGGCGVAFNALEYLSEQMPEQPTPAEDAGPLPELTPEPRQSEEPSPKAISAEQSAALLKTLDELAGSDIRIEDTGVEWRVLDDEEVATDEPGPAPGSSDVDEFLDESPTPVDQFLTKTPNTIDASEIFEASANAPGKTEVEELRFDDNTPLPDDFDIDDESSYVAKQQETGTQTEAPLQTGHPRDLDKTPVDLALGEPEEWADILGEFTEPPRPYVPPLDAELSALEEAGPADETNFEPAGVADRESPLDVDTQFALQAEAMGIDLSGMHAAHAEDTVEQPLEEDAEGEDAAVPVVSADALDEAATSTRDDELAAEPEAADETGHELAAEDSDDVGEAADWTELELADETGERAQVDDDLMEQPDSSTQQEAEALTPHASDSDGDAIGPEEAPLEFGAIENAMAELEEQSDVFDNSFFEDADGEEAELAAEDEELAVEAEAETEDEAEAEAETDIEAETETETDAEIETALDDIPVADEPEGPDELSDEAMDEELALAAEQSDSEEKDDEPDAAAAEEPAHVVPPLSEEEQTLNLMIDQELLNMAVEDEDGFASTIVFGSKDKEDPAAESSEQPDIEDTGTGFESIIMEGEFVRTAVEQEKRKANIAEAAELAEKARQEREAEAEDARGGSRRGMAAAAAVLVFLLVVQVLHQSREALATIPAFNETVGPLYRAIGMPLSPAWDVTGWRFEARRDILDEAADTLTVISRIGNTSDKALPYPLVNISLTDRFEEIVGTRTLDPADYLTDDLDPSKMVRPGNNFTAVMTIESPAENATGYKLQACYRQPDAQLRCHIPTFK